MGDLAPCVRCPSSDLPLRKRDEAFGAEPCLWLRTTQNAHSWFGLLYKYDSIAFTTVFGFGIFSPLWVLSLVG